MNKLALNSGQNVNAQISYWYLSGATTGVHRWRTLGQPPDMEASGEISQYPGRISSHGPNGGVLTRTGRGNKWNCYPPEIPRVR